MADAACHGSSHLAVPEDGAPARELEVRGDHEGLPLVALGYDLEEQPRPVGVEREDALIFGMSRRRGRREATKRCSHRQENGVDCP